jgi:hypothetical protein
LQQKRGTYGDLVRKPQGENSLEDLAIDGGTVLDLEGTRLIVSEVGQGQAAG